MAFEIKMPQLGLTMEEGTVAKWIKQEGETVNVGDIILEITTDKLTSEITSEYDGVLIKIVAQEGEDVPVKGTLAYIGEKGEIVGNTSVKKPISSPVTTSQKSEITTQPTGNRIKISPLAKKTAAKLDIDYSSIKGSGPMGRIIQKDILSLAETQKNSTPTPVLSVPSVLSQTPEKISSLDLMEGDEITKLSGMRKVVAERMTKSAQEIPTVTQNVKIDVTNLILLRKKINIELEVNYSLNDYIIKAVSKALKSNRHILVSIDGDKIIKRAHINIGMAVALDEGLIVPVIKDADKMSLDEISKTSKDLAQRARTNKLNMNEYKGSTFTISNLGMFGVETFNPIINQPDAGILGVCAIQDELVMDENGTITKRQFMRISFTFDHRLIDGATAAKFELAIKELLENPMKILV